MVQVTITHFTLNNNQSHIRFFISLRFSLMFTSNSNVWNVLYTAKTLTASNQWVYSTSIYRVLAKNIYSFVIVFMQFKVSIQSCSQNLAVHVLIKVFIRNLTLIAAMQGFIHKGSFPLERSANFLYMKIANDL